ncbi:MAG: nucleotidyltransferase family protein [Pseudomonadota bacterium]
MRTGDSNYQLSVLLLAAGGGRRIGGNKPLTRFGGRTLLERAVEQIRLGTGSNPIVVTGANLAGVLASLERLGCALVHNRDWKRGMGSSIATGIRALAPQTTHCMLALVDQPLIDPKNLRDLLAASRGEQKAIVVSEFGAASGPPAIFPRSCFSALAELTGDIGAKNVVRRHHRVVPVRVPGAAHDVDDPGALAKVEALLEAGLRGV